MAKHNYSQYSNKKYDNKVDVTPEDTVENQNGVIDDVVTEEVVTTLENKSTTESNEGAVVTGVIANCVKLNVRSNPSTNGDVITILNVGDKISIDVDKSTKDWFKIRTVDGVKGYCMRKFVNANI